MGDADEEVEAMRPYWRTCRRIIVISATLTALAVYLITSL